MSKYIKDHVNSSVVPGSKWGELQNADPEFWQLFYDHYDELFEAMDGGGMCGRLPSFEFNLGMRARPEMAFDPDIGGGPYRGVTTRSRMVNFHPALSAVSAFIKDKKQAYSDVINGWLDVLDFEGEYLTPLVDGGKIYDVASRAFDGEFEHDVVIALGDDWNIIKPDGTFIARDGSTWESYVATILGEPFYPSFTAFGGGPAVPSGVYDTSINDGLGMMWLKGREIPGVIEYQDMDAKRKFILGLSFAEDHLKPRLQGIKLSADDPTKAERLQEDRVYQARGKNSTLERKSWLMAYEGELLNGEDILSAFTKVSADRDYFAPREVIREVLIDNL